MDLPILYEDADIIAINKPAGLITHSDGRTKEPSVAEWILESRPSLAGVGEPWTSPQGEIVARPGIVHRLDRETSGVLVIAKTHDAYAFLKQQFHDRSIEKKYRAFVYGHPKENSGIIEAEIVRVRAVPPRWGVAREGEEKKHRAAITKWRVISRGTDDVTDEKAAFIEVEPKTGRTHQIRVHFKHINHAIVCDPLYAKGRPCILGFSRTALHAFSISLSIPSGERHIFEAPLPDDFVEGLRRFEGGA